MEQLLLGLRRSGQTIKLLLSGHRGSGKTTELNRLAEHLEKAYGNRHEVTPVDISRQIVTLTYHDVVLGMALAVFKRAFSLKFESPRTGTNERK
ncbi:MAG: ATP-binding protein [Anaerolineales bacterium]|nr:ATP-binding protein [Anaerolineales bacterium]